MPSSIVTGIDVYPDNDPEHACASIRRVGGGVYLVTLVGEDIGHRDEITGVRVNRHEFDTVKKAEKFANDIAKFVEVDPTLTNPASVHTNAVAVAAAEELDRAIVAHAAELAAADKREGAAAKRIATLEARLAKQG